ncbi:MAG: ABC transporter permease [Oscillospiraceae bacterium]|nr:ABC transporter permease [Oscillospiraceae bacterium]
MEKHELRFESPSFFKRLRGMLSVDFYRLFHTPMYYIFLAIAAMIPALILGTSGMPNPQTGAAAAPLYTNTWHIVAAETPLYVVNHIGEYANMNMVFLFGGIMVSIFIGHDYKSGYVKQLFTTHAKKQDYMISKTLVGAFSMACMCVTYLLGGVGAGLLTGTSMEVHAGSLVIALLSKLVMSLGWASLYTFLNVIFRRYFGISIASCFFFGTGILIIGAAAIVGNSSLLNVFLYGASVYACLSSTPLTLAVCLAVSAGWAAFYTLAGTLILNKSDVY